MNLGLTGRVALVCGSTRGIGRAVAKLLAEEGAQVAVNGRDPKTAPFPADVTVPKEAERLVQDVAKKFGRLDILFCNAGGPPAAPFKDLSADAWQKAIDLNLLSTIHLARAAVPIMTKAKWGRIICLASIAALQPLPGLILSSTARAGVLGFAKALSDEVAKDGITVNSVCPGFIAWRKPPSGESAHRRSSPLPSCFWRPNGPAILPAPYLRLMVVLHGPSSNPSLFPLPPSPSSCKRSSRKNARPV